jgi:hypothetical protein
MTTQRSIQKEPLATFTLQKVQTALMSISTILVIGCFKFLWGINAFLSAQTEINGNTKDNLSDLKQKVEFLEKQDADYANRLTKIESSKTFDYGKNLR